VNWIFLIALFHGVSWFFKILTFVLVLWDIAGVESEYRSVRDHSSGNKSGAQSIHWD